MGSKDKKLCKWGEGKYCKSMKKIKDAVSSPKFVCEKCGRAASRKSLLCKPVKLDA